MNDVRHTDSQGVEWRFESGTDLLYAVGSEVDYAWQLDPAAPRTVETLQNAAKAFYTEYPDVPTCQWFARCDRPAVGVVDHPMLGDVPCCQQCADKLELNLRVITDPSFWIPA